MGRPYNDELAATPQTLDWAAGVNLNDVTRVVRATASHSLVVIGSGGSVTACHLIAKLHAEYARQPVRVLTPYEFLLQPPDGTSSVLLVSAGGANRDILKAAEKATTESYENVCAIIAKTASPLQRRLAELPHTVVAGFDVPFGKDGFLAVNSLLATSILVTRAYAAAFGLEWTAPILPKLRGRIDAALRPSILVLAAGWSWPAALDLESKFNEAGLGTAVCADHRNFAHGRHHGLARRALSSGVVALSTPDVRALYDRTLRLIPAAIPRLHLITESTGATGTINLIGQVFQLVGRAGEHNEIDPGKPHVADFGRRLYSLSLPRDRRPPPMIDVWIQRKVSCNVWCAASERQRHVWRDAYKKWADVIGNSQFSAVALDYDGTLCEAYERAGNPRAEVVKALSRVLREGLRLGIATGRGDSVLNALRSSVPQEFHSEVVVGLYNGAVVGSLADVDERLKDGERNRPDGLDEVAATLESSEVLLTIAEVRRRYGQLTITQRRPLPAGFLYRHVIESLCRTPGIIDSCAVHESGHSIDVIQKDVSKLLVVGVLGQTGQDVLTIGDQGQFRGNDFAFLSRPQSLSVERVSTALDRCWNLAPAGWRGTAALLRYLDGLRPDRKSGHRLSLNRLERS
jgi:fructoselysine-6-P-deglycase FrlB-like protein